MLPRKHVTTGRNGCFLHSLWEGVLGVLGRLAWSRHPLLLSTESQPRAPRGAGSCLGGHWPGPGLAGHPLLGGLLQGGPPQGRSRQISPAALALYSSLTSEPRPQLGVSTARCSYCRERERNQGLECAWAGRAVCLPLLGSCWGGASAHSPLGARRPRLLPPGSRPRSLPALEEGLAPRSLALVAV